MRRMVVPVTGPTFDQGPPLEDEKGRKYWDPKPCICGVTTYVDAATGLCVRCWRAWRFQDDEATRIGRAMLSELRGRVFVKRGGSALDFCEFGLFLLEQAGGVRRLLKEWDLLP